MIAEPVQAVYNNRGTMCILGCKLTDNGNAVCDRVTCLLYLFHSRDNTMKVALMLSVMAPSDSIRCLMDMT